MSGKRKVPAGRLPGGQRGNKNALKHGLYALRITPTEDDALSSMKITHLEGEIAYLRVVCGRLAKILEYNGLESETTRALSEATLKALGALDKSLTTLLSYIRQHALLTGETHELDADIRAGQDMARKEMGVFQYLDPSPEE